MTKLKEDSSAQETLFDWLRRVEELRQTGSEAAPGSLDIDAEFRHAVSADIKHARDSHGRELSRYEVAARMSELAGQEITMTMLNNYTAEAHEKHRFPCQFLPAFVLATGGQRRAFEVLSRRSGLFALPGPDALRAEIRRLDEEIRKKQLEKSRRVMFLKEVEKEEA